jgi:hypothetical protein
MRTLLLGTDFSYNHNGNLVPIEINTNVGWDPRLAEYVQNSIDTSQFKSFVINNNFTKVTYIGGIPEISVKFNEVCTELGILYDFIETMGGITIPYVEDSENHLIVRSAYDISAIVDETYCKDKVNFLELIKNESFGSQFAYLNENNQIVSNITNIPDNGIHPNFILKAKYPVYDKEFYPTFFRVLTFEELTEVINTNVNSDYFLMEYHLNQDKLTNNIITVIRSLNILYPPTLQSIHLCAYKKFANIRVLESLEENTYDDVTHKISAKDRNRYLTGAQSLIRPKLLDTDLVVMSDGTFKTGADLQVGDVVKTIRLYENQPNISDTAELREYNVPYEELLSGSTFSSNVVTSKKRVDLVVNLTTITFDDGSTWKDTVSSVYLVKRENNVIWTTIGTGPNTQTITHLEPGDKLLLISVGDFETISFNEKLVVSVEDGYELFSGYVIGVQDDHIFLTATNNGTATLSSYVAVEHNYYCQPCYSQGTGNGGCHKYYEICTYGPSGGCGDNSLHCVPL